MALAGAARLCARHGAARRSTRSICRRSRRAAWQIGLGCLPVAIVGLLVETSHLEQVTPVGWWLLVYSTVVQFCIAYVSWFAALARLPASVAAIGTMAVPVIGVVASAIALGEPLGPGADRGAGLHAGRRGAGDALAARTPVTNPDELQIFACFGKGNSALASLRFFLSPA